VRGFDTSVDQAFDRLRGRRVPDRIFYAASMLGDHGLIWLLLATLRALKGPQHTRAALRTAIGVGIESAIVNVGIKSVFRRVRPRWDQQRPLPLRRPKTSSFPSGHATSAFCAAALLSEGDRLAPLYYLTAIVVASSRIHVKIHHASDVVAGIAVGAVLGRAGRRLWRLAD
jgi:undecaprenyl-diphosphatase